MKHVSRDYKYLMLHATCYMLHEELDCNLCNNNIRIDYKNRDLMRKFVTSQFKIITSRRNKLCNKHQRVVANAVKNSRYMALLPYTRLQVARRKS